MSKQLNVLAGFLACAMTARMYAQGSPKQENSSPKQPVQPLRGPGSSEAVSSSVVQIEIAEGAQGGWIFLPSNPAPKKAPVVILCHGWSRVRPRGYQAWINHLVMRGNIVIWPNYQDTLLTPTRDFLPNAIAGVKAGFRILQSSTSTVSPDLDRVAVVGHSAGGMIAAGIGASAASAGLPKMRAVMPVEPGDSKRGGAASVPLADLATMPSDTLLLILAGQDDSTVGTHDGERILHESVSVPEVNRALFMLPSDDHGVPALVANHYAPAAMIDADGSVMTKPLRPARGRNTENVGVVDALDYMGIWRLLDQLLDAAFAEPPNGGFLQDPAVVSMGTWSDGVKVKPLTRMK